MDYRHVSRRNSRSHSHTSPRQPGPGPNKGARIFIFGGIVALATVLGIWLGQPSPYRDACVPDAPCGPCGECSLLNSSYTCNCTAGFFGSTYGETGGNCSLCDESICNDLGVLDPETCTCECDTGWGPSGIANCNQQCTSCVSCSSDVCGECYNKFYFNDPFCVECSNCTDGEQYQTAACNATSDAICADCTVCSTGTFARLACTTCEDTLCLTCQNCTTGTFQVSPCTSTVDRSCTSCSDCEAGLTYQDFRYPCGGLNDTTCNPCTVCDGEDSAVLHPCNATHDTICCDSPSYRCNTDDGGCIYPDVNTGICPTYFSPLLVSASDCTFNCSNGVCPQTCGNLTDCTNAPRGFGHTCECKANASPVRCATGFRYCDSSAQCTNSSFPCDTNCTNFNFQIYCNITGFCVNRTSDCPSECTGGKFLCHQAYGFSCVNSPETCPSYCGAGHVECPTLNGTCVLNANCPLSSLYCIPALPSDYWCPSTHTCLPFNSHCAALACEPALEYCPSLATCINTGAFCNTTCACDPGHHYNSLLGTCV